jgi:voltage-gated potassium channel
MDAVAAAPPTQHEPEAAVRTQYEARSPEAARQLAAFDAVWRLPILLSATVPLIFVGSDHDLLEAAINIVAWLVFVVDLLVHRRLIPRYLHTNRGRFDLVIVILTAPWFLIPGLSGGGIVMLARLGRLVRLMATGPSARRLVQRLGRVFIVAISVLTICSLIAYRAEHPTNPEFATIGDAFWWGIVTLTTVGYGDVVPETLEGRLAGVLIMVTGVAVLGLLAGNLASFLRLDAGTKKQPEDGGQGADNGLEGPGADGHDGVEAPSLDARLDSLDRELAQVRSLLEELHAARVTLGTPSPGGTPPSPGPPPPPPPAPS